jgi:perosamine synthetase
MPQNWRFAEALPKTAPLLSSNHANFIHVKDSFFHTSRFAHCNFIYIVVITEQMTVPGLHPIHVNFKQETKTMMLQHEITEALSHRPTKVWSGEPLLGSSYGQEEIDAAVNCIRESMDPTVGFGFSAPPIPDFEQAFAKYCGTKYATAVNSCGPAIDIIMRYLKLQPGDEVIVPSCNYVASPLSVYGHGGQVIWGDVLPDTLQLDPEDVERKMSPRTRAIFPVHMNGLAAPIDDYIAIAEKHPHPVHGPAKVISDAARACGGGYKGNKIGKAGWATVFSFHTMKNMTTLGEGGMITTDDPDLDKFAHSVRMYGIDINAWGTSNVMTKVQAAVGLVQLSKLDSFIDGRRRIAHARNRMLADVPGLILPVEPADCYHSYYLYTCRVKDEWAGAKRDELMATLDKEFGFRCVIANPPVYAGRKQLAEHTRGQSNPVTEHLAKTIFCVPLHPDMPEADNKYICAAIITAMSRL